MYFILFYLKFIYLLNYFNFNLVALTIAQCLFSIIKHVFAPIEILLETAFKHPQEVAHFPCAPSSDHRCKRLFDSTV